MSLCVFSLDAVCIVCQRPARHARVLRECQLKHNAEVANENTAVQVACGPGAELKRLLSKWPFRIVATPSCPCNAMAALMDSWGPDGCEKRMPEIVEHMRAQAQARGLPFLDAAARMLVRRAVSNARRSAPPPADTQENAAQ